MENLHLFFTARCVPIQVNSHFTNGFQHRLWQFPVIGDELFHHFQYRCRFCRKFRRMKSHHGMAMFRELPAECHHGIHACRIDVRKHQCRCSGLNGALYHLGTVGIEFFAIDMAVGINEFHRC